MQCSLYGGERFELTIIIMRGVVGQQASSDNCAAIFEETFVCEKF